MISGSQGSRDPIQSLGGTAEVLSYSAASPASCFARAQMAGIGCSLSRNKAGVDSAALTFAGRALIWAARK